MSGAERERIVPLRLARRFALDPARIAVVEALAAACARVLPGCRLRLNRNRRTMLSLRGQRGGRWTVSLHAALLDEPQAVAELPTWVAAHGRRTGPALRQALRAAWLTAQAATDGSTAADPVVVEDLPTIGHRIDLQAELDRLHGGWFAHLSKPEIRWARQAHRRLSHIRFGSYRRDRALISLHPRLAQPWIARAFVEHVIFHELCHHAQACDPRRREPPHSPRFRAWEQRYPQHAAALAWERRNLARLLDGSPMPTVPA